MVLTVTEEQRALRSRKSQKTRASKKDKKKTKKRPKKRPKKSSKPKYIQKTDVNSKEFLESYVWRKVRYECLQKHGAKCLCCGRKPPAVVIHVDHIKPRRKYPELALDVDNLQPLCHECNHGKGNRDETDWREKITP